VSADRIVVHPVHPEEQTRAETVALAARRGFHRFVLASTDPLPSGSERILLRPDAYELPDGRRIPRREAGSAPELSEALREGVRVGGIALRWSGDRVIPLENTLAEFRGKVEVWVTTSRISEVPGLLGALEHGADSVVIEVRGPAEIGELEAILDARPRPPLLWSVAHVVRVAPVGLSDRVLLDTSSLLGENEGFAIGSRASALFHVRSEALGSTHSRPRRFRVNGGAAHSYVLMADGGTRYLSELEAGEELLAVDDKGRSRGVRLGRLKIERRPTLLLEATVGTERASVFLQEAETVRLSSGTGALAVTSVVPGDAVLVTMLPPARHMGRVVDEAIEER
jgi:3-dehydroquinate synthase II